MCVCAHAQTHANGLSRWSATLNWNDRWNDATTNAKHEEQRERVWSYALNLLESCVAAHPALAGALAGIISSC